MWLYIGVLATVLLLTVVFGDPHQAFVEEPVAFTILLSVSLLGGFHRVYRVAPELAVSVVSILLVAAAVLVGPSGAAIIATLTYALPRDSRNGLQPNIFNAVMVGCLGAVVSGSYRLLGGATQLGSGDAPGTLFWHLALPLLLANVLMAMANALLIGGAAYLDKGVPVLTFAAGLLRSGGPAYIGYGFIGFMLVVLWAPVGLGPVSLILVLVPILVAQWASSQVAEETKAHERTVAALIAAGESENLYSENHSARVALLCERMAAVLGLDAGRRHTLRLAALLHDIGTMAIPSAVWRTGATFTAQDVQTYRAHPERGVEMLAGIDFLTRCHEPVVQHHERWDGRGYPAGLAGEQICLEARIIAVADAFDSLTSTRSYRPALTAAGALEKLRPLAGSQFDPALITALGQVLARDAWASTIVSPEALAAFGPAKDHDDPGQAAVFLTRRSTA